MVYIRTILPLGRLRALISLFFRHFIGNYPQIAKYFTLDLSTSTVRCELFLFFAIRLVSCYTILNMASIVSSNPKESIDLFAVVVDPLNVLVLNRCFES